MNLRWKKTRGAFRNSWHLEAPKEFFDEETDNMMASIVEMDDHYRVYWWHTTEDNGYDTRVPLTANLRELKLKLLCATRLKWKELE